MCAIVGVYNSAKAAELAAVMLHALQHRAIDYAGMATSDGTHLYQYGDAGVARSVFTKKELDRLHGRSAIGHTRYPTVNDKEHPDRLHIQPIRGIWKGEEFFLAHNGNLTNRKELEELLGNMPFETSMDTECIVRLLERETGTFRESLVSVTKKLRGSYALVILFKDRLIVVQDPSGNRPLSVGARDGAYVVASETCAFTALGAGYWFDVGPGMYTVIDRDGSYSLRFADAAINRCLFELTYYSHSVSSVFGRSLLDLRIRHGKTLEEKFPVPGADFVVGVPDSGTSFAVGWGMNGRSGPFLPVITRSHYVGRTFIKANQELRDAEVAQKFQIAEDAVRGKRIVLIDDSIVRLTTLSALVRRLRLAGVAEVHARIAFPPVTHPCFYGINTPTYEELAAAKWSIPEIQKRAGVDSLEYFPLEDLLELAGGSKKSWCAACVTGKYWHNEVFPV